MTCSLYPAPAPIVRTPGGASAARSLFAAPVPLVHFTRRQYRSFTLRGASATRSLYAIMIATRYFTRCQCRSFTLRGASAARSLYAVPVPVRSLYAMPVPLGHFTKYQRHSFTLRSARCQCPHSFTRASCRSIACCGTGFRSFCVAAVPNDRSLYAVPVPVPLVHFTRCQRQSFT
ncbi:hypothetical protein RRG08_047057, partial [Elysia crispata]